MHGNCGCTVEKLVENSLLCAYPQGAELSYSRAMAAAIFDRERDCGVQLKRRKTQRHESNHDFPHALSFFQVF